MKIGDKLFKKTMFGGHIEYVVLAEIKREKAIQYEVECQSCQEDCDIKEQTGENCRLLIQKVRGKSYYEYVAMVNDSTEDTLGSYVFHCENKKPYFFYTNLPEARTSFMEENIRHCDEQIKKASDTIATYETEKIKFTDILNQIK